MPQRLTSRRVPAVRRLLLAVLLAFACSNSARPSYGQTGTQAAFDLDANTSQEGMFFEQPWPSDLRLTANGRPDLTAFPNRRGLPIIEKFRAMAMDRPGFPVVPVAYFRFSAPLAPINDFALTDQVLLIDLQTGARVPVVIATPPHDEYVPLNVLAAAPRPGFVLAPGHVYAFVVLRTLNDAAGAPLGVPAAIDQLRAGVVPEGAQGAAARTLFAPLWPWVAGLPVAAATCFSTGDVVAETFKLSEAIKARFSLSIDGLAISDRSNDRACVLSGRITYPQFQQGTPPFDTLGLFDPSMQKERDETAPIVLTVPKSKMPARGYPLAIYFHGSGGASTDVIDYGPTLVAGGKPTPGQGPGWVLAGHGIAAAASALPVNPERLPGAVETAYLNFANLPAMRDTFRQGIIEQRLFLEALKSLQFTHCDGTKAFFDPDALVAQGQSMGGMYTNLVSAVEPRVRAAVPTGAGGFWTYFILVTHLHDGLPPLVALLLETGQPLSFLHPALQLVEMAWEPADPFVSMPRLARRPLPGHPVRPIYEPVGMNDQYFPTVLYDAVSLSYGHNEAGSVVWPAMQDALALAHLDGLVPYPVQQNRKSETGAAYTGVVVQYQGDGIEDPHAIYRQLGAVKHQYGCFLESFLATGTATVFAPNAEAAPCAP
jgi:hypothetical protein